MATNSKTHPVDIIAELRLRQWARRNYVPLESRRDEEWHPVVLDEMCRKDSDLMVQSDVTELKSCGIVPLMPSLPEGVRLDARHAPVPAPQFLNSGANSEMLIPYYI